MMMIIMTILNSQHTWNFAVPEGTETKLHEVAVVENLRCDVRSIGESLGARKEEQVSSLVVVVVDGALIGLEQESSDLRVSVPMGVHELAEVAHDIRGLLQQR